MEFNLNSLLASFVVSAIGFVLFSYGRKLSRPPQVVSGLVLLVFPYFVSNVILMFAITAVVLLALWFALRMGH